MPGDRPRRGDIYHVRFDPPIGPHYAVVISSDAINRFSDYVLVAIITSKDVEDPGPHEFKLPSGLLPKPSKVKCQSIVQVFKKNLNATTYVTTIPERDLVGLDIALMQALDLGRWEWEQA